MKFFVLIFSLFLSPLLSMEEIDQEDTSIQLEKFRERLRKARQQTEELHQIIDKALEGEKHHIENIKECIAQKCNRLSAPLSFNEALNELLDELALANELFTHEERTELFQIENLESLKPLKTIIGRVRGFITNNTAIADHAKIIQLAADQTRHFQGEWDTFLIRISDSLETGSLTKEDLKEIFKWVSYFFNRENDLAASHEHMQGQLNQETSYLKETLSSLEGSTSHLSEYFHLRGTALWRLLLATLNIEELPQEYHEIPSDYFREKSHTILTFLDSEECEPLLEVSAPRLPIVTPRRHLSLSLTPRRTPRNTPRSQDASFSSPRTPSSPHRTRSQDTSFSSPRTPSSPHRNISALQESPKSPGEHFIEILTEAFTPPEDWSLQLTEMKKQNHSLLNASFIVETMHDIVSYYEDFKSNFLSNLSNASKAFAPTVTLVRPGRKDIRVPQHAAAMACCLKVNGPFCIDYSGIAPNSSINGWESSSGGLTFHRSLLLYPGCVGEDPLQFYLESLFGLESDPTAILHFDEVVVNQPQNPRQQISNRFAEDILRIPDQYVRQQQSYFVTAKPEFLGETLLDLFLRVRDGNETFENALDPLSAGKQLLFSMLMKETIHPHDFGLVKGERKHALKRIRITQFLQPLFRLHDEGKHQYIGFNTLYYLPLFKQKVPEEVRREFLGTDINLVLSLLISQLNQLQSQYDNFSTRNDLYKDFLCEEFEQSLSKKKSLGLSITTRKETIKALVADFTQMATILRSPDLTYEQLLEKFRPTEYDCYQYLLETAERRTPIASLFFRNVMGSVLQRLHATYDQCQFHASPFFNCSLKEIESYESELEKYIKVIVEYEKQIDELKDNQLSLESQIDNAKYFLTKFNEEKEALREETDKVIGELREKVRINDEQIRELNQRRLSRLPESTEQTGPIKKDASDDFIEISLKSPRVTDPQPGSTPSEDVPQETSERDLLIKQIWQRRIALIEQNARHEEAIKAQERKLLPYAKPPLPDIATLEKEYEAILLESKAVSQKLLPEKLFSDLEGDIGEKAQAFFKQKFRWASEMGIFHASFALQANDAANDTEKEIIYENILKGGCSVDFSCIPTIETNLVIGPAYSHFLESNQSVEDMAQEFLTVADLSTCGVNLAYPILEPILQIVHSAEELHPSVRQVFQLSQFLAPPPLVRYLCLFCGQDGQEAAQDQFREAITREQLKRYEAYQAELSGVGKRLDLESVEAPGNLFRRLWRGGEKLPQKDTFLLQAICDLLLLPPYSPCEIGADSDPGSIGFTACNFGETGIFRLESKGGEHYLNTWSEAWAVLFQNPCILSAQTRTLLTSHPLPLLFLQWAQDLIKTHPDTSFRPWYTQTLLDKSKQLQEFVLSRWDVTFNDLFFHLFPEIYYVYEMRFKVYSKASNEDPLSNHKKAPSSSSTVESVILSMPNEVRHFQALSAVEQPGDSLDWCKDGGKNIFYLLEAWDQNILAFASTPSLNLNATATEFLRSFNPAEYNPEILDLVLEIASTFDINFSRINTEYWRNPQILLDLKERDVPLKSLQCAASMRTGYPIELRRENRAYTICGTRGNFEILCELISLFEDATDLYLPHNSLWTLTPVMETLRRLPDLTGLHLNDNPLHNLHPLGRSKAQTDLQPLKIKTLTLSNTSFQEKLPTPLPEPVELESKRKAALSAAINTSLCIPPSKMDTPLSLLETYKNDSTQMYRPQGCEVDKGYLFNGPHSYILKQIAQSLLDNNPEDLELIICLWEKLAERHWKLMLDKKAQGYISINPRRSNGACVHPLNIPLTQLFDLLKQRDPRVSAFKLLFALTHDLPPRIKPKCLIFSQLPNLEATHLTQLTIPPLKFGQDALDSSTLESFQRFKNLTHLFLCGNKLEHVHNLPYLPMLQVLDLRNNLITSMDGLYGDYIKFPILNVLILSNNRLKENGSWRRILSLPQLAFLDLQENHLTEVPKLASLELKYLNISENLIKGGLPDNTQTRVYKPQKQ